MQFPFLVQIVPSEFNWLLPVWAEIKVSTNNVNAVINLVMISSFKIDYYFIDDWNVIYL
jgi:hypothetical protein